MINSRRRSNPGLWRRAIATFAFGVLASGCGESSTAPGPERNGTIALRLNATADTIVRGGATQVAATLTRGGGFVGSVSFRVDGVPAGVTGTVGNVQTTGPLTTATVTISVGPTAVAGTYPLTVSAEGNGVNAATATYALTVEQVSGGSYSIRIAPTSHSVLQRGSTLVTVTLERVGFTGRVLLALTGAPPGVTGQFSANNIATNTSVLTLNVGPVVPPGLYTILVGGVATGQPAMSAPIELIVGVVGTYSLSLSSNATTIAQGTSISIPITVARADAFSGNVALTLTGLPTGLTAGFDPASTVGTTASMTLTAASDLAPGVYPVTVRGTTAGLADQTFPLNVSVRAASGTGNVTVSFASCDPSQRPIWFAYQDGTEAVVPLSSAPGHIYTFDIVSGKGGYFYMTQNSTGFRQVIGEYATRAELTARTRLECAPARGTKVVYGTVLGLGAVDNSALSLGGASYFPQRGANLPFAITGVADGTHDFIAYRSNFSVPGTADRMILRRDQNIAANGTLGLVDFGGTEAFAPAQATLTIIGGVGTYGWMDYLTGPTCNVARLYTHNALTTSTIFGVPASLQRPTDLHSLTVTRGDGYYDGFSVSVTEQFKLFGNRTVTLGPQLDTPSIVTLPAPFKRLQAAFAMPTEYRSSVNFTYYADGQGSGTQVSLTASFAWLGSPNATIALPDFSSEASWNNAWIAASPGYWTLTMTGSNLIADSFCQEGGRISTASLEGYK